MSERKDLSWCVDYAIDNARYRDLDDDNAEYVLAELATLRAESAELHKLLGMLNNGAMARAGRDMWHELRRYRDSLAPPARGEGTEDEG